MKFQCLFLLCICGNAFSLEMSSLHLVSGDEVVVSSYLGREPAGDRISPKVADSPVTNLNSETAALLPGKRLASISLSLLPIFFTTLSLLFLTLCISVILRNNNRPTKLRAESLLMEKQRAVRERISQLDRLTKQSLEIERKSDYFTGKTESLATSLSDQMSELVLMESSLQRQIQLAETLVYPQSLIKRLTNFFSNNPYLNAIELLEFESIVINDSDSPMPLSKLLSSFEQTELKAIGLIERLNQGILGLPKMLKQSGDDMEKISQRLAYLSRESHRDGFFPLINLQTKLVPSTETLLDQSAKIGATDPVSALESPARLATRQISDALLITEKVKTFRRLSFPGIQTAVKTLDVELINSEWVDREFFAHSKTLETLSQRAVLWSISEKLERLSGDLHDSRSRVIEAAELANRIRKTTLPAITTMEKRIGDQRREIGKMMNLVPDDVLQEGEFDPAQRITRVHQALQLIKESIGRGKPGGQDGRFCEIDQLLGEANDLLLVCNNVIDFGEDSWVVQSTRLERLSGTLPEVESALATMKEEYHSDVLHLKDRFGEIVSGHPAISDGIDEANARLGEIEELLHHTQIAFEHGKFLTAGRQIEQAASDLDLIEHQMRLVINQSEALSRNETQNSKTLGDLRWRHRSLIAKVEDRRTRKPTAMLHHGVKQRISQLEQDLEESTGNPFKIANQLNEVMIALQEIEDRLAVDWFWHEFATDSLKSAARTLRSHSSVLEILKGEVDSSPAKLDTAIDKFALLKQQLEDWQGFLEEQSRDWKEGFEAGLNIEIASSEAIHSVSGDIRTTRESCQILKGASQHICGLLNWENHHGVALNREAGIPFLDEARTALVNGEFEAVCSNTKLAKEKAINELTLAIALEKRTVSNLAAEKRKEADALLNPSLVYADHEPGLTCPVTAAIPGALYGFSRHRFAYPAQTKDKINGHSTKTPRNGNGSHSSVGQLKQQPKSLSGMAN